MNCKRCSIFFCSFISATAGLFADSFQNDVLSQSVEHVEAIVAEAPEVIKQHNGEKYYLNENMACPLNEDAWLILSNKRNYSIHPSLLFSDNEGLYLTSSSEVLCKKLFKNVCNSCKHEWEGGVFTVRCPKCGSSDISNVPNW